MKYVKIIVVLSLVAVFSAAVLSAADLLSRKKILENESQAFNQAITMIVSEAKTIEEEDQVYKIFDYKGDLIAYIFLAEGQGYQGLIKIICGVSVSWDRLLGIEILDSKETPGLGARINRQEFKTQFKGLDISNKIGYTKAKPTKKGQIQAITGATVSSRSVVGIVNKRIEELKDTVR